MIHRACERRLSMALSGRLRPTEAAWPFVPKLPLNRRRSRPPIMMVALRDFADLQRVSEVLLQFLDPELEQLI